MTSYIFHLIPHTHWDREWYLPRAAFHARLVPMLDDLVARLQAEPALRSFLLDGQTVLVEDYLRARPERESDVKALVKTGRLQVGPWYVLADEYIPSGESLIRNLLYGTADAERLGDRLDVLYSPDAFGHPAVLPALAREFGIKFAVVWRGLGGEPGQTRDLYRWRAPDGREVLLWHLPPQGYEIGAALPGSGALLLGRWAEARGALVKRAAGKHLPVFIGADHHAVHPALAGLRDLLAELEPASAFRFSRLDEFFQSVEAAHGAVVSGELRWSYRYTWTLQGVHGTRTPLKRRHGEAELRLERYAEPLAALARRHGGQDRRPVLEAAWRTLLRAQFHDTLAGTTVDAVAAAAEVRLADVAAYGREVATAALHELAGHDADAVRERAAALPEAAEPALLLWNPAARARGGIVVADVTFFRRDVQIGPRGEPAAARAPREGTGAQPFSLRPQRHGRGPGGEGGESGEGRGGPEPRPLAVQILSQHRAHERLDATRHYPDEDEVDVVRVAFRAPPVPGLGLAVLGLGPPVGLRDGDVVRVRGRSIENRFVSVALDPSGGVTLLDRRSGRAYSGVLRLEDEGDDGDAYSFAPARGGARGGSRARPPSGPLRVRRLAPGPLLAALDVRWSVAPGVDVRAVWQLDADSPVVRVSYEIENRRMQHRLRARLATGLAGVNAVAGAAFCAVERPAVAIDSAEFPLETPAATAPAQRFVAAAGGDAGIAVLAPAFFEYEWTPAGDLLVTLLRAVGDLSRADLPTRPGHAAWPTDIPGAQCVGRTRVDLAVVPISGADLARGDRLPELWEDAFLPVAGRWLRQAGPLRPAPLDVTLEGAGLVLSSVKPAQLGSPLVLRCYNATDRKTAGAWRFGDGIKTAHRVRADEREAVALVLEQRGQRVRFVAEPHEIVTILVT